MSWEHINLNMTPGGEMPVVHVSQFDTYRAFTFNLYVGEDEWTIPESARFELHCRKVDDNIVIIEPLSTDTSSVTFLTTEQLTACAGKNKCELVAIDTDDDSLIVGSINFILDVEADPLAGGITSETAISNLTQQIEDIAEQVIGEDYYDKTEVDNLLALKVDVTELANYYTKSETNTLLNAKADASDVYTKSQVDTALATKANTSDLAAVATSGDYDDLINKPVLPDMTQYYTKSEVDTLLDNQFPTFTASGDIASFTTALNKPLVSVNADPLATTITRCGINLVPIFRDNEKTQNGVTITPQADGSMRLHGRSTSQSNFLISMVDYSNTLPSGTYTFSIGNYQTYVYAQIVATDHNLYSYAGKDTYTYNNGLSTSRLDVGITGSAYDIDIDVVIYPQLETGSTANTYSKYSSVSTPVADADTITTLSGVNNVFADSGSVTVQYKYMSM